jgi:hypothetical protein
MHLQVVRKTGYPNFFSHTICMKYLLLDAILIIKQIKPKEYENTQHMLFQYLMESSLD